MVSLLRVHPALADHVRYLGYVPKLLSAVAFKARRETMSSEELGMPDAPVEGEDNPSQASQTPQEKVRLSCLRVLHQLAASTTLQWRRYRSLRLLQSSLECTELR